MPITFERTINRVLEFRKLCKLCNAPEIILHDFSFQQCAVFLIDYLKATAAANRVIRTYRSPSHLGFLKNLHSIRDDVSGFRLSDLILHKLARKRSSYEYRLTVIMGNPDCIGSHLLYSQSHFSSSSIYRPI